MDSFKLELEFQETGVSDEEAHKWLRGLLEALPVGATGKIVREPKVLDVQDVTAEHEGYQVTIQRATGDLTGKLDAVYPTTSYGRIFVLNGRAHEVRPFEVATLIDRRS